MLKCPELFHIFLSLDHRQINALSMLYQCLIIRLLLSLSCSVSLWLESAQRSRSLEEGLGGRAPDLPACLRAPGLPDLA